MNLEGLKIAFLGDSITEGVGTSSPDKIYHSVLCREAKLSEAINYGISATRFSRQSIAPQTHDEIFLDRNAFVERFGTMRDDVDAVVVFGGTNDFGHGNAPLGTFADRATDTFYGACHCLFSGLVKKYLGKPIVIMTPLHRTDEIKLTENNEVTFDRSLKDYVNIIREVSEYYSLPVLDLYALSGMQPAIKEIQDTYIPDGLHPNDNGNAVIARKLRIFLEAL